MAFEAETFYKAAYKKLYQFAHTDNEREPFNEPFATQVLIAATQIIGEAIPNAPGEAVAKGIGELVECELTAISGTDYGWRAVFPSGYSGYFGAGVIGQPIADHTFQIPTAFSDQGQIAIDGSHNGGYAEVLEDNGAQVPASGGASGQDWIWDPYSCIATFESADSPTIDLGSTGTIWLYLYTGNLLSDNVKKNNFTATVGPTTNDNVDNGYSVGSLWVDVSNDRAYVCLDDATGVGVWSQIDKAGATGDHGKLDGLDHDDHTQYALLDGRGAIQNLSGGTTSGGSLRLLSTSNVTEGNIIIGPNPDHKIIASSTSASYLDVNMILGTSNNAMTSYGSTIDTNKLAMWIFNDDTDEMRHGLGIGFHGGNTVGAAIVHQVTKHIEGKSEGVGKLHFATKESGGSDTDNIPIRMTLDESGNLGIGTTGPTELLHIKGATGASIYIDGQIGVDGIIFPDLTVQTTAGGPGGATDHGALTGLGPGNDDHRQYARLAGRTGQTLYGGTGALQDLQLLSTSHGTKGDIFIGDVDDTEKIYIGPKSSIIGNQKCTVVSDLDPFDTASTVTPTNLQLIVQNTDESAGAGMDFQGAGIGLSVDSTANTDVGAAIVHERVGSQSQGKLHFATKETTTHAGSLEIQMTIDESGQVGIGRTSPTADLDVHQGTGVIKYKPTTPGDWSSPPNGVFEALDDLASSGGGASDHGDLTGLGPGNDDHRQYARLAGRTGQTLYGGTGAGQDLQLLSTSHGTLGDVLIASQGDTEQVSIGGSSVTNSHKLEVTSAVDAMNSTTTVAIAALHQVIQNDSASDNAGAGLGFTVSGGTSAIGAAIVHERITSNSKGRLHFATKTDTGGSTNIPIHMTIDENGRIGIGVVEPSTDLDVYQGTGVIKYKPTTPGDWSSPPGGVFEALDELASSGGGPGGVGETGVPGAPGNGSVWFYDASVAQALLDDRSICGNAFPFSNSNQLYIKRENVDNISFDSWIDDIDSHGDSDLRGYLHVSKEGSSKDYVIFKVDGSNVYSGINLSWTINVEDVDSHGSFNEDDRVNVTFTPVGPVGATGPSGGGGGSYTPADEEDWWTVPTTVTEALDELAATGPKMATYRYDLTPAIQWTTPEMGDNVGIRYAQGTDGAHFIEFADAADTAIFSHPHIMWDVYGTLKMDIHYSCASASGGTAAWGVRVNVRYMGVDDVIISSQSWSSDNDADEIIPGTANRKSILTVTLSNTSGTEEDGTMVQYKIDRDTTVTNNISNDIDVWGIYVYRE